MGIREGWVNNEEEEWVRKAFQTEEIRKVKTPGWEQPALSREPQGGGRARTQWAVDELAALSCQLCGLGKIGCLSLQGRCQTPGRSDPSTVKATLWSPVRTLSLRGTTLGSADAFCNLQFGLAAAWLQVSGSHDIGLCKSDPHLHSGLVIQSIQCC